MSEQQFYYVIYAGEDGVRVEAMTGPELEGRLNENHWGSEPPKTALPKSIEWESASGVWIIKGRLIAPKPVQQVTKWEL